MNNPQTFTIVQNQTLEATGRNKTKQNKYVNVNNTVKKNKINQNFTNNNNNIETNQKCVTIRFNQNNNNNGCNVKQQN